MLHPVRTAAEEMLRRPKRVATPPAPASRRRPVPMITIAPRRTLPTARAPLQSRMVALALAVLHPPRANRRQRRQAVPDRATLALPAARPPRNRPHPAEAQAGPPSRKRRATRSQRRVPAVIAPRPTPRAARAPTTSPRPPPPLPVP